MVTLEQATRIAEKDAIITNLSELRGTSGFSDSTRGAKVMKLAMACGLSSTQTMEKKLKAYEIEI